MVVNKIPVDIVVDSEEGEEKTYLLDYYGAAFMDRRYNPVTFRWLAKEVIKRDEVRNIDAQISSTQIKLIDPISEQSVCKAALDSIYRLSHLKNCNLDQYFAYITLGSNELHPCKFHVFSCPDPSKKNDFLKTLKARVLGFQRQNSMTDKNGLNVGFPKPTHRRGVSSGAILVSPVTSDAVFRDSVYYIGKVTISKPQAPPKFIDDVLIQFQKMHTADLASRLRRGSSGVLLQNKTYSFDETYLPVSRLGDDSFNTDGGLGVPEIQIRRRRSSSCSSDTREKYQKPESLKDRNGSDLTLSDIDNEVNSRLVTLQISKTSLMLFSVGSKTLLLEKKINNISFCTKGEHRSDHFGFVCREGSLYICYVFQGESEHKVDDIMKAMKHAFAEALEANMHLTLCDYCPIHYLHKICEKLEGVNSLHEKTVVLEESMQYFTEYEQLHIMDKVNDDAFSDEQQKIEITVKSMRDILDQKQKTHKHIHKYQDILGDADSRDRSKSSTIFEKAKKSLTSSLQTLAQKKPIPTQRGNQAFLNSHESSRKPRSRSCNSSSCPVTPDFSQRRISFAVTVDEQKRRSIASSIEDEDIEKSDDMEEAADEISEIRPTVTKKVSWRQAIYHSVTTPSRKSSTSSIITLSGVEGDDIQKKVDPGRRARERWRNAIMSQIVLIRMEKENKKLAAKISATETRRQKLSYEELGSYTAEAAHLWDEILKNTNERIDSHLLREAIRGGVPKARRGEIWQLLMKQSSLRNPVQTNSFNWKDKPYKSLVRQNTQHQHAILIDLGRTFPTHAHFIPRLGSGQIALYNILKSYSLLDPEVGYCQGLSFVAGLLLMHMSEEDTFKSLCYMMFDLNIRIQYKPDMNAVQQQMYQLSRLLHDYHPALYEHFNKHDVTPTLYAAPWFLTLYASQYPVGFVARVMDLVFLEGLEIIFKIALTLIGKHIDEILQCDSFENIVDYMKLSLPEKVANETDEICITALDMDIKQKLNLYEAEYQLLNEEMIDIRQNKEKYEKQELKQKALEEEVIQLKSDLSSATNTIALLKQELELANQEKLTYQNQIRALCSEKESIRSNKHLVDGCEGTQTSDNISRPDCIVMSSRKMKVVTSIDSSGIGSDLSLDSVTSPTDKTDIRLPDTHSLNSSSSTDSSEILITKNEKI